MLPSERVSAKLVGRRQSYGAAALPLYCLCVMEAEVVPGEGKEVEVVEGL